MTGYPFSSPTQPADNFVMEINGMREKVLYPPRRLCRTRCFDRRRWMSRYVVQVYCDNLYFWCGPGFGCKKS